MSELLLQARRFNVFRETLITPEGKPLTRDVVRHPGAVVVLPMVDPEHVCMIRQFRISVNRVLIELPAGTLEPNEPPQVTAGRELIEETGYTAEKIEFLHAFLLSPGILDEKMHLFRATQLTLGKTAREEGEEIENLVVPLAEARRMIYRGEIEDAKTIVGLLWGLGT
jgi:ADP-ribose pyrophosphatase